MIKPYFVSPKQQIRRTRSSH